MDMVIDISYAWHWYFELPHRAGGKGGQDFDMAAKKIETTGDPVNQGIAPQSLRDGASLRSTPWTVQMLRGNAGRII